jgi:glycosyltransferase-like protein LARGE
MKFFSKSCDVDASIWVQQDGLNNPLAFVPRNFPQSLQDISLAYKPPVTDFSMNSQYLHKCCAITQTIRPASSSENYDRDHWADYSDTMCIQGVRLRCRSKNTTEAIADIHRIGVVRSKLPKPELPIGIVTDLNIDELNMLRHQCLNWPQPISAALYLPLVRGKVYSSNTEWNGMILMQALELIDGFHKKIDQEGNCQLDIEIVAEERCNGGDAKLYPGGALRNRALHLSTTEMVLLLDNNCIVDKSLGASSFWQRQNLYGIVLRQTIILLQTFETRNNQNIENAIQIASKDKKGIDEQLELGNIVLSSLCNFSQDYRLIVAKFWMESSDPFEVHFNSGYFPNMIMLKKYVPYFDERIFGKAATNVLHMMDIGVQSELKITMDPEHYLVRLLNNESSKKQMMDASDDVQDKYGAIIREAHHEMKGNCYAPVTNFPHLCLPAGLQRCVGSYNVVGVRNKEVAFLKMAATVDVNMNLSAPFSIIATIPPFYKSDGSKHCRVRLSKQSSKNPRFNESSLLFN